MSTLRILLVFSAILCFNKNLNASTNNNFIDAWVENATIHCQGSWLLDPETQEGWCEISNASQSTIDYSWEFTKLAMASVFGPSVKAWVVDPILNHLLIPAGSKTIKILEPAVEKIINRFPVSKYFKHQIFPYALNQSQETMDDIEELFAQYLARQWIKQLDHLDKLFIEGRCVKEPLYFKKKEDILHLVGYKYSFYKENNAVEISFMTPFDKGKIDDWSHMRLNKLLDASLENELIFDGELPGQNLKGLNSMTDGVRGLAETTLVYQTGKDIYYIEYLKNILGLKVYNSFEVLLDRLHRKNSACIHRYEEHGETPQQKMQKFASGFDQMRAVPAPVLPTKQSHLQGNDLIILLPVPVSEQRPYIKIHFPEIKKS